MGAGKGRSRRIQATARRPSRPPPKPGERRPVMISIQPEWSRLIQNGTKTVELRRQRSGCEPGTKVAIYTSFPVKRVEAIATVAAVHALAPDELWQTVGAQSATSREDFFSYLGDLNVAYGIELSDVQPVTPFALGRSGPQSWRYLFADEPEGQEVIAACEMQQPSEGSEIS